MGKKYRPLLILGALLAYQAWKMYKGTAVLGTRTSEAMQTFKDKLTPIAQQVEKELGISAKIGMTQAAHESGYGSSQLSRNDVSLTIKPGGRLGPANNLFGFTAEPATYWRKQNLEYVEMPTTEWKKDAATGKAVSYKTVRPFRAYQSWELSYRDWARLMQTQHYVDAGGLAALKAGNIDAFAIAMNKAGYATDPNYGAKLVKVSQAMA